MKYTTIFLVTILLTSQSIFSNKEISQGCNDFACNMYQELKKERGNVFFIPLLLLSIFENNNCVHRMFKKQQKR